jgi:hypothetical protein
MKIIRMVLALSRVCSKILDCSMIKKIHRFSFAVQRAFIVYSSAIDAK